MRNNLFKEVLRKHSHKFFWLIPVLGVIAIVLLSSSAFVQGEKTALSFYPDGGTVVEGDYFEVAVRVEATQDINAITAHITYPPDKMEVVDIFQEKSILKIWVQEAEFADTPGSIQFAGGLPNPGFRGIGEVLTILFRARDTGWAPLGFLSAEVLANDGKGTNVLEETHNSIFYIQESLPRFPDFNNSGRIDFPDLAILISQIGKLENARYDVDGDGLVNIRDISLLFSLFGKSRF